MQPAAAAADQQRRIGAGVDHEAAAAATAPGPGRAAGAIAADQNLELVARGQMEVADDLGAISAAAAARIDPAASADRDDFIGEVPAVSALNVSALPVDENTTGAAEAGVSAAARAAAEVPSRRVNFIIVDLPPDATRIAAGIPSLSAERRGNAGSWSTSNFHARFVKVSVFCRLEHFQVGCRYPAFAM